MFILDMYRYVESAGKFTRQDLAKFVYLHRESKRLADSARVTHRFFASAISKEFLARCCTLGYLDLSHGVAWCRGIDRRPFEFEFRTFDGAKNEYIWQMMNIGGMSDEDIFRESDLARRNNQVLRP